jgi:Mitochondrial carrier protein
MQRKFCRNLIGSLVDRDESVGAVLYTSYLQSLALLHEPSSRSTKRTYPPPDPRHTFLAGFVAGGIQSFVAAPLDAIQVRFKMNEMIDGHYRNMWHYAFGKLREIGPQGIFAGWSLSLLKDTWGCALFFSTFEFVKAQAFYSFVRRWYGREKYSILAKPLASQDVDSGYDEDRPVIRPHYLIEPTFILLAGITASVAQNVVQHPITQVQNIHFQRLESLDYAATLEHRYHNIFRLYYHAYEKTYDQCRRQARRAGGWRKWLYRGLVWNTIRQVPSTSAGLIVFEIVRRKYADYGDAVRIEKDGYDVLLT